MPDLSRWDTSVTEIADSRIAYRGKPIEPFIAEGSLADTLWLVLFGTEPHEGQADALRRALIAALDHGPAAPSTLAARATASTRSSIPFAIAAGLIAFAGPAHGGAAEEAAKLFRTIDEQAAESDVETAATRVVDDLLDAKKRMPGYGHPYHAHDPRVPGLLDGTAPERRYRTIAVVCERIVLERTGKPLHMNADSAVAALLLDAGLDPGDVTLVTALGRAFGLAAHAREEQSREKPFRAPGLDTIRYAPDATEI
jgi:citrate synthase